MSLHHIFRTGSVAAVFVNDSTCYNYLCNDHVLVFSLFLLISRISNDLSYVKAGYRSDKWKWVLSLSEVGSLAENVRAVGEHDSSEVEEPAATAAAGETGDTKLQKDVLQSEVNTSKTPQRNGTTQNHATLPQAIFEEQLTTEQILKTYGVDKLPKQLPCQYVDDSNFLQYLHVIS